MEKKIYTTPLNLPKSRRRDNWRGLTSMRAGVITPVAYFPLLREDSIRGGVTVQVRMAEAVETIINPIRVKVQAYLVPKSAMKRFDGSMETLNRTYMGQTLPGGGAAPPWDVYWAPPVNDTGCAILDKLGLHYNGAATPMNTDLIESYNCIVNWRRRSVSLALPERVETDQTLAEAFWDEATFNHIKASFDAAMMEGSVPVDILNAQGGRVEFGAPTGGTTPGLPQDTALQIMKDVDGFAYVRDADNTAAGLGTSYSGTGTISLANIALATKTMAFAKMRERYQGIPDEYLIDMLTRGLRVPPEDFREPILLGMGSAVIGQQQRWATDGASLDQSVTNGLASLRLSFATPAINPGGMVLVLCEIMPSRLFERTHDYFMDVKDPEILPDALRDTLDPQKVEITRNKSIDTFHATPEGIFGYEPLNAKWQRQHMRVGGRFKRDFVDGAWKEDRGRIWAIEVEDPTLSDDLYLAPNPFPHDVFAETTADPFEIICIGETQITGLTVFGSGFEEDDDHYEKIMAQVDQDRIESVAPTGADGLSSGSDSGSDDPAVS